VPIPTRLVFINRAARRRSGRCHTETKLDDGPVDVLQQPRYWRAALRRHTARCMIRSSFTRPSSPTATTRRLSSRNRFRLPPTGCGPGSATTCVRLVAARRDRRQAVLDRSADSIVRVDRIDLVATIDDTRPTRPTLCGMCSPPLSFTTASRSKRPSAASLSCSSLRRGHHTSVTPNQWRLLARARPDHRRHQVDTIIAHRPVRRRCLHDARNLVAARRRALYLDIKSRGPDGRATAGLRIPRVARPHLEHLTPLPTHRVLRRVGQRWFSTTVAEDFTTGSSRPGVDPTTVHHRPPSDGNNPPCGRSRAGPAIPEVAVGAYRCSICPARSVPPSSETGHFTDDGTSFATTSTPPRRGNAYGVCPGRRQNNSPGRTTHRPNIVASTGSSRPRGESCAAPTARL